MHPVGWHLACQISPHRCNDKGIGPQKLKFYWNFTKFRNTLHDFHKICSLYLISGWVSSKNRVVGVLSWGSRVSSKFSVPPSGETMRRTWKSHGGTRTCSRSSITVSSLVGLGFYPLLGRPKTLSYCLFVLHAFERQSCAHDFAMKVLEYRNDFDTVG